MEYGAACGSALHYRDLANWEEGKGEDPVFWSCEFMRLGENDDDVESRASTDAEWLLRLSRAIETDY